jgi:hypothetical protein
MASRPRPLRPAAAWALGLAAGAALGACATAPDDTVRDLATLSTLPDQGLEAPDTVRAGVPFTVTGYGAGSGTVACNAPDGTTVTSSDTLVRIVAYMRYPTGETMCTKDYRSYPFTVQVRLSRVGTATVRFVGAVTTYSRTPVPDSLVKRIVVRP